MLKLFDWLIDNLLYIVAAATFWFESGNIMLDGSNVVDCANCPCGYTEGDNCTGGSGDVCSEGNAPQDYSVTLAGVTDNGCSNCSAANAEWVMAQQGPSTPCVYILGSSTSFCGVANATFRVDLAIGYPTVNPQLTVVENGSTLFFINQSSGSSIPITCDSLSLSNVVINSSCNWPSSVTVSAV